MSIIVPNRALEAEAFLSKFPDIRSFHLMWTDLGGVQRGKLLRRDDLAAAWKDGRYLPISAMVLDVTGQDVPETGLVFDEGDRDLLLWPVPGSLVTMPWSAEPSAQYIATMHDLDGTPAVPDPRNLLSRMDARLREQGMVPVGAVELEFFLMDRDAALSGHPQAPKGLTVPARPLHYQAYNLQDLDDLHHFSPISTPLRRSRACLPGR